MVNEEAVGMANVLVLLDNYGYVKYCSDNASVVLGLNPEEVAGQSLSELLLGPLSYFMTAESINSLLGLLRDSSRTSQASTIEISCTGPHAREFVVTVFPTAGALEEVGVGLTIRDVTEEREARSRRDTFIAVLSHELRDPITALMGFTRLLLETSSLSPTEREWLDNVKICGQRLAAITSDMLDVEGIRSGNLSVDLQPVHLRSVVDEVLPLISGTYGKLECSVFIPPDLPTMYADRNRLAQVMGNLLSNAVKYSPEGGQARICAHYEDQTGRVVVAVADQGLGIAPGDMENIFSAFQRSLRPETQGVKGVGLGLYIVKGLVELMNGELWVESEVGRGSTFYLSFPTAPEPSPCCVTPGSLKNRPHGY